ncbi:hypothetical protein LCGC14_2320550, partial [marine sediment metagenome]
MPLRLRFLVALLAVIAVSEAVIVVTFYKQQQQYSITERMVTLGDRMHSIADFQFGVAQVALQASAAGAHQVSKLRSELDSFQAAAKPESREERLALRTLGPRFESLVRARAQFDRSPRTSRRGSAAQKRLFRHATALVTTTEELHRDADLQIRSAEATAETRQNEAFRTLVVGSAISLLAAIVLALLLARTVSHPVARLAAGARELGSGRLEHRLAVESRDEIGIVAEEFNRMAAQLEE